MMRRTLALGLAVMACAARQPVAQAPRSELDLARRATRDDPSGWDARRARWLAEWVAPGGDLAWVDRERDALTEHFASDPRVRFADGVLSAQRGEFERCMRALIATIEAGRTSDDPLGSALAEAAVAKVILLRGDVEGFDEAFSRVIEHVREDRGRLSAEASFKILETAVRWARERGDAQAEARWVAASGCVTGWSVVGPFGPLPLLRFDEHLGPDDPGPLAGRYALGDGRAASAPYTVRARGCAANLGRGATLTGVLYANTDFTLDAAQDVVLRVESPNLYTALVDGVRVATVDPRVRATGPGSTAAMHLAAGTHTLRIKIGSEFHAPLVIAALTDPAGRPVARFSAPRAAAHASPPVAHRTAVSPADSAYLDEASMPSDPFTRYALAELAFARRNPVAARELLRPLATAEAPTPTTLIAWGAAAQADPFVTASTGRDRARRAFEGAQQGDPRAYYPVLQLARLAAEDERGDEALTRMREAHQRFANNPEVDSDLADRLMQRNWDGEARALLDAARRQLPSACWPVRMLLSLAQRHGDGQLEHSLSTELSRCDALSDVPASTAARLRRYTEAAQAFDRLLDADPEGRGLRRALMELDRSRGRFREALERGDALLPQMPEDDALRADMADLHLAQGHRSAAQAVLDQALSERPAELASLFRLRSFLSGIEDLEPWRLDGRAVLRAFEASGRRYDASAVLVLDYTVRRNYADGSALELTHNIIRVQSREGVEAYGEFSLPNGASLLGIRTLKQDGRVLLPEEIAGKDTLSLPELRPGDAVEFEYVRVLPQSDVAPGGFVSDRFFFRGFEVPYDRSEYTLVVPAAMRLTLDPRGPAPAVEETEHGALRQYRWRVRESDRLTPEPSSVAAREFIPSVAAGANATWLHFVNALRARLSDLDVVDPEAVRLTRSIVGDAPTRSARLAALHRWVTGNIQQEGAGTPFESAPRMLSARAGHRTRVLCYMAKIAEIPCEIALVRQGIADSTPSDLADDDTFQSLMLRVQTEDGERFVTAADSNAPLDYMPPAIAGGEAMLLTAGAPRTRLPAFRAESHQRLLTVELRLLPNGSAEAEVEERLRGYAATGARQVMRRLDAANRDRQFEAYVGGMVAGASLRELRVEGTNNPQEDMVFRYRFTAPGVATRNGDRLVFDGIFHADAATAYAQSPTRTAPLWNGDPVNATLDLTVTLDAQLRLDTLPDNAEGASHGVQWSFAYARRPEGFHLLRRVMVPTGRVTAAEYRGFAESIRALDTADTRQITMQLR